MLHRLLPDLSGRKAERTPQARPLAAAEPSRADAFPVRAAAIDVGSNAIRFLAAEFLQPLHYTVIEQVRTPVRLGHDVFLTGRLADDAMDAAVEALAGYRRRLEALEIRRHRAVATSAVRDSRNGDAFRARVRRETGIELEVITGAEEARLVARGAARTAGGPGGRHPAGVHGLRTRRGARRLRRDRGPERRAQGRRRR